MTVERERAILIPSSLTMESRDRRESTLKVGQIARAAAVFRMNRIVIYRDPEFNDSRFITMVLRYMDTPQYLRRMLIPRREELRHVGMLPPLRTPHHPINSKSESLKIGEFRVGAVVESVGSDGGVWVEIGIDRPRRLNGEGARRLLKVQCEMGGKNPVIVLEDADIDLAVTGTAQGAFGSTGQRCTATSRVVVQKTIAPALIDRLIELAIERHAARKATRYSR